MIIASYRSYPRSFTDLFMLRFPETPRSLSELSTFHLVGGSTGAGQASNADPSALPATDSALGRACLPV